MVKLFTYQRNSMSIFQDTAVTKMTTRKHGSVTKHIAAVAVA